MPSQSTSEILLYPGDVLTYRPERNHCREGIAVVNEDGKAADTFWRVGGDCHLTAAELETVELRFRLGEYHEVKYVTEWLKYAPEDRQTITSQHGIQSIYYVRNGATEDLATQIAAAYAELREAEGELQSAGRKIEWAARKIAALEARRDGSD